jgi:hypothetical protein
MKIRTFDFHPRAEKLRSNLLFAPRAVELQSAPLRVVHFVFMEI